MQRTIVNGDGGIRMQAFVKSLQRLSPFVGLAFVVTIISLSAIGSGSCDRHRDVTGRLDVSESEQVPGRALLDASNSITSNEEIVSYVFTVIDRDTEETVAEYSSITSKNSTFSPILGKGNYLGKVTVTDETGATDTTETLFSLEGNCISETNVGQCCTNNNTLFTCVLSSGSSSVNWNLILQLIAIGFEDGSDVNENTVMWIQAWGATGGDSNDSGAFKGGTSGFPGFAQTITTISEIGNSFFYYIGNEGHHGCCGGPGGAGTIVTTKDLECNGCSPDIDRTLLVAGGAGGAGGANAFCNGRQGKNGGTAIATTTANVIGQGESNGSHCNGGSVSVDGDGGFGDAEPNCNNANGGMGIGGLGGGSQDGAVPGWVNASLNNTGGGGGFAGDQSLSGAGGGGYGGGGGTCGSGSGFCACDTDCSDCPGQGGCGGGSFAKQSTEVDPLAPSGKFSSENDGGEVRLVFDLNP